MTVTISRDHNPLRDPDDRRLNRIAGPSALVIFGVTGDLTHRLVLPSLYNLAAGNLLPAPEELGEDEAGVTAVEHQ